MPLIIKTIIAFALSAIGLGVYHVPQPRPDMATTAPTERAIRGCRRLWPVHSRYLPICATSDHHARAYSLRINMGIAHGYQN
jgi:hypothetical protein